MLEGFDLVVLDFEDGADWIQKNSELLQVLIEKIEDLKQGCDNPKKNTLIGASMGGQISRHALAKMEQDNTCHNTKTYVSFDSPHKGANISMGLQAAAWFTGAVPDGNNESWDALHRPAPRQLLARNLESEVAEGNLSINEWGDRFIDLNVSNHSLVRNQYVQEMESLGFPSLTRNIAIADGSEISTSQGYSPPSRYLRGMLTSDNWAFKGDIFQLGISAVGGDTWNSRFDFKCECIGSGFKQIEQDNIIFSAFNPEFEHLAGCDLYAPCNYYAYNIKANPSIIAMDHVSGGKRSGDINNIKKVITEKFEKLKQTSDDLECTIDAAQANDNICFIPTMSALAIDWEMNNVNLNKNIYNSNIIDNKLTPFDAYYAPNSDRDGGLNLRHVELTQGMIDWLDEQMDLPPSKALTMLPHPTLGNRYNYGYKKNIIQSVDVQSGGQLEINQCGATGFDNEPNASSSHYTVYTACKSTIHIQNGAQLNIGNLTCSHSGSLVIREGSTLHIHQGAILNLVQTNSSLVIEPGATLILDEGAIVNLSNGNNDVDDAEVKIHIQGTVLWNGDIVFNGNGHFRWASKNDLRVLSKLNLRGLRKTCKLWHLESDAEVNTGISDFHLDLGKVIYEAESKIINRKTATLTHILATKSGIASLSTNPTEKALVMIGGESITIEDCEFRYLGKVLDATQCSNATLNMSGSLVNTCRYGLDLKGFYQSQIDNCDFGLGAWIQGFQRPNDAYAVRISESSYLTIQASSFRSYSHYATSPELSTATIGLKDVRLARIESSDISGNDFGIAGTEGANNLYVAFSTFNGNHNAIKMNGGRKPTGVRYGLVDFQCVSLINNTVGIKGQDILLEIDNAKGKKKNNYNTFESITPQKIFDINYISLRPSRNELLARYNYWINGDPRPVLDYNISGVSLIHLPKQVGPSLTLCTSIVDIDNELGHDTDDNTCQEIDLIGQSNQIAPHFETAYQFLRENNMVSAQSEFNYISSTFPLTSETRAQFCQDMIEFSSVFSTPSEGSPSIRTKVINEVILRPNPIQNKLTLQGSKSSQYELSIYKTTGELVHESIINSGQSVDCSQWSPAIYIYKIVDKTTGETEEGKLIKY
ncbi:MAG: T9SS type A sorting domain-containing protein [Saprospiraceae bacterium]|nr:T9SS type A sorting domain-containing protein [Saprospiraceae bacterium]